jgi:glycosyltransferase involved in cell wall biosynthesis
MDPSRFDLSICWYTRTHDCLEEQFAKAGVRTVFFDKFSMPMWRFFGHLRKAVRDISPDVIHTWMYSANFWGRWAAVTTGARRIVSSDRVEVIGSGLIERISERLLVNRTIRLANSRAVAQSLQRHLGLCSDDVRVIYNGVEAVSCDRGVARAEIRDELGLPRDQKLVIMVARQARQKNYPTFVRAGARVCRDRDDVTFVGVGRGDLMDELTTQINQLGVNGRVRFVGLRSDVHRWLAAADVFCFTSDYEGFPNAVLEAMMAGLPVVTTSFAGLDELMLGRDVAEFVPLNDDEATARAVIRLLDDADRRRRLGDAARILVEERFSWTSLVETMSSLYSQVAEQSRTQRGSG